MAKGEVLKNTRWSCIMEAGNKGLKTFIDREVPVVLVNYMEYTM